MAVFSQISISLSLLPSASFHQSLPTSLQPSASSRQPPAISLLPSGNYSNVAQKRAVWLYEKYLREIWKFARDQEKQGVSVKEKSQESTPRAPFFYTATLWLCSKIWISSQPRLRRGVLGAVCRRPTKKWDLAAWHVWLYKKNSQESMISVNLGVSV